MNRILIWILVLLPVAGFATPGEDRPRSYVFRLDQAVAFALDNSYDVKNIALGQESARFTLKARRGAFKTNMQFQLQAPDLVEELTTVQPPDGIPVYRTIGSTLYFGQFDINQPLPTSGVVTLSSRLSQTLQSFFNQTASRSERKDFRTSLSLRFSQPLFTPNLLKLGLEEADLNFQRNRSLLQRTRRTVIFEVTQAFYQLYRAAQQEEIARLELEQQQATHELARKKYTAGLIPEVEALQTEVDLAQSRNRLFSAQATRQRQEDVFKQTIGLPLADSVRVETEIAYTPISIDLGKAVRFALQNRYELNERRIEKRLREIDLRQTDARSGFNARVSAFYDLSGVSTTLATGTDPYTLFRESLDDLEQRPKNKGVSLTFNVPVWDAGVNGAEVAAAQARLEQAELGLDNEAVNIEREVKDVVARVQAAQNRLEVLEKSRRLAERSHEISLARFDNGDITTQELALDRDRLTRARSDLLDAYVDYETALADLSRKTLYDFENDRPLHEEAADRN